MPGVVVVQSTLVGNVTDDEPCHSTISCWSMDSSLSAPLWMMDPVIVMDPVMTCHLIYRQGQIMSTKDMSCSLCYLIFIQGHIAVEW